tara:strand:+ start:181 stop:381 length:201 start_codon:yes stop_codon:yes gene_type:complete
MSIPVEAMHSIVREDFLGAAEKIIEKDDGYKHPVAGRDAVRLAYIMSAEAGNDDQWDEATAAYRGG